MKLSMRSVLMGVLLLTASPMAVGCAAPASEEAAAADEGATSEDAITSSDRKAQLDALRARVQQDFAGAASLRDKKLVFVVKRLNADDKKSVIFAHIMKRDASGKDAELADADFKGSAYEELIQEGVFDGPEVTAVLKKANGTWSIAKKGTEEAYVVGPTDVAYETWDRDYGVPRAWLGFSN